MDRISRRAAAPRLAWLAALLALTLPLDAAAAKKRQRPVATVNDSAADTVIYGMRDDVMRFADELALRRGLDADALRAALRKARYQPRVAQLIMPPPAGTAKNWAAYRARFIEPQRVRAGVAFWREQEAWLRLAEERFGVPAEIVVGIVGVETLYGRHTGGYRVIDALATLSFDFPAGRRDRSAFFRDELEAYLVWCQSEGLDPLALKGSYAGAIGLPQFMPSSIVRFGIDFDGDGHIDLQRSRADVIGSVAHYLAEFGWQPGMPTHYGVAVPEEAADRAALLGPDIVPTFSAMEFEARGAQLGDDGRAHDGLLALVELHNGEAAPSYVAGTANFYAVTRYNWSSYYALAVIELGRAVALERMRAPF